MNEDSMNGVLGVIRDMVNSMITENKGNSAILSGKILDKHFEQEKEISDLKKQIALLTQNLSRYGTELSNVDRVLAIYCAPSVIEGRALDAAQRIKWLYECQQLKLSALKNNIRNLLEVCGD